MTWTDGTSDRYTLSPMLVFAAVCGMLASGCAQTSVKVAATSYDLHVAMDPAQHSITGQADVVCAMSKPVNEVRSGPGVLEFEINPNLTVTEVSSRDVTVTGFTQEPATTAGQDENSEPVDENINLVRIQVDGLEKMFDLKLSWNGKLVQDVSAGEVRGQIHNFKVNAHVSTNGIHLSESGRWYPAPHNSGDNADELELAHYRLEVAPVAGYTFVAGADTDESATSPEGGLVVESSFPQPGMALVGARFKRFSRTADGARVSVLLRPEGVDDATLARRGELFLNASIEYLQRYEPLLGPYPFKEFSVVENFFSSGFAFPTFTLLGPEVIAMEERALRHGYLDHELLHNWWGNSVYVDPAGGNWCEALADFGGNLYGFVLDGDEAGARSTRRNYCNSLSGLPTHADKPLASFGQQDGAGRGIGYQKGAMVFHMLSRLMGEDRFWEALRVFAGEYRGRTADWNAIKRVCQRFCDVELDKFFDQWVYGSGIPDLTLERAWTLRGKSDTDDAVYVRLRQGDPAFDVDVPLRIHLGDESDLDVLAHVSEPVEHASVFGVVLPAEVELDPEFEILRNVGPVERKTFLSDARLGKTCTLIAPDRLWEGYETFCDDLKKMRGDRETVQVAPGQAGATALRDSTVVIVGPGVHDPEAASLLAQSECPIQFGSDGFTIDGAEYDDPAQAVLCTVHHPDAPQRSIAIYYGNSPEALSNAGILGYYTNSLLVFETEPGDEAQGHGGMAKVILRADFEGSQRVPVERDAEEHAAAR